MLEQSAAALRTEAAAIEEESASLSASLPAMRREAEDIQKQITKTRENSGTPGLEKEVANLERHIRRDEAMWPELCETLAPEPQGAGGA